MYFGSFHFIHIDTDFSDRNAKDSGSNIVRDAKMRKSFFKLQKTVQKIKEIFLCCYLYNFPKLIRAFICS